MEGASHLEITHLSRDHFSTDQNKECSVGVENCLFCFTPQPSDSHAQGGGKVFNSKLNRMGRRQKEQVIGEASSFRSQGQKNTSSQVSLGEEKGIIFPRNK